MVIYDVSRREMGVAVNNETQIQISNLTLSVAGKTLIVPGCSASLVENFALDWIIHSLKLNRVAIASSPFVAPMVQSNVFGPHITSAFEVYSAESAPVAVVQIRSLVSNKRLFARNLIDLANSLQVENVLVLGSASGFLLSGAELENPSRLRVTGLDASNLTPLEEDLELHECGMLREFLDLSKKSETMSIATILALTSGFGYTETQLLSEELARVVLTSLEIELKELIVPQSVKALAAHPKVGIEVGRIL